MKVFPLLLAAAALAMLYLLTSPTEGARESYRALIARMERERESDLKNAPFIASQERKEVVKNIYTEKDRLHSRIEAASSRLTYDKNGEGSALVEELEGVTCIVQMELFYLTEDGEEIVAGEEGGLYCRTSGEAASASHTLTPVQRVRRIAAHSASYSYTKESLLVDHPAIAEYRALGHALPESFDEALLLVEGVAESATLSFSRSRVVFSAKRLKGSLHSKGGAL